MFGRRWLALRVTAVAVFAAAGSAAAPSVPTNFVVDDAAPGAGLVVPTGIAFLPDGRFFVCEKRGRVYEVRSGIKRPTPIWANENEVLDQGDRGLLDVALDPNYFVNHYLYLLYSVDPDTNGVDDNTVAFNRLTRYQVNFTDSASVIPSSRTILFGHVWPSGPLVASDSHAIGSLRWGRDGSLLVSTGDGAHYEYMDPGGKDPSAFLPGRTDPNEDIGSFRSLDITNLCGKVLRINPATGQGYASNPYVNGNLGSVQSRIWCYGLRNPFRFNVRPGTGSVDTSAANPGTLYIGDVGWTTWEETNVARSAGSNFGWPCYEGFNPMSDYQAASPAHNGCGSFGTPTNPATAAQPLASWNHSNAALSRPSGFAGNCSIGGVFYTGIRYPAQYRNQYLFGDYGADWIKLATVDASDNLISITDFAAAAGSPVDFATDPLTGDVFYVAIGAQQVRHIRYNGVVSGNTPPVAVVSANPVSGLAPLGVAFSSAGSSDPDGDPITTSWLFADGSGSSAANPTHVFAASGIYNVQLTVSDNRGGTDVKYVTITVGAAAATFPTTPILDSFNRANGAVGGSWVDETANFTINTNALAPASGDHYIEWNGATFGPNQEAFVTLSTIGSAPEHNLMLKTQGATWSSGHIEVSYDAANSRVFVYTFTPPSSWTTYAQISGVSFAAGDQFGARVLGDGTVRVYKNGAQVGTGSVASWPYSALGGRIGVLCSNATASRFDNFGGGNVASSGNTKPVATILAPPDNSFYYAGQTVNLMGSATDAESPPDSLGYRWIVDLYHNTHVHPSTYTFGTQNALFTGENHDDGTGVHLGVKLTASDPQGAVSDTVRINLWPEIDLAASAVTVTPATPTAGQSANYVFTLTNSGRMPAPISRWVLRAGGTVLGQGDAIVPASGSLPLSVDATLPTAGTFTLRLTADSLAAVHETNETNNVSVRTLTVAQSATNTPPVANATGTPQSGTAPLTVNFSGATSTDADGDSLTFSWGFGDATAGSGRLVSHSYSAGNYAAILTVSDGRGGTDTASVAISVTVPPPPPTFPQTTVLDNFNRANGMIGGSWIDQTTKFSIASNQLTPSAGDNYIEWNTVFGANQEAFVTMSAITASAPEHNLMLKTQGTTWASGHIEVSYNAPGSRVYVYTFTPPSAWATVATITGVTFAAGNQFGARVLADGSVRVYKNGVQVGSGSVAGWPYAAQGGRIGVSTAGATTARLDDFGGGAVTGAAAMAGPAPPLASRSTPGKPPSVPSLSTAFPNPTSGSVTMWLALPVETEVELRILDVQGREVWSAPKQGYGPGRWSLGWDGRAARGRALMGIYLARVRVGSVLFLRRIAIIR